VATILEELGWLCYGQGKFVELEQFPNNAVAIYAANLGQDHHGTAGCTSKLGPLCLREDYRKHPPELCAGLGCGSLKVTAPWGSIYFCQETVNHAFDTLDDPASTTCLTIPR